MVFMRRAGVNSYLNQGAVSPVEIGGHVEGLGMERRALTHEYQGPTPKFLEPFCEIMSPVGNIAR